MKNFFLLLSFTAGYALARDLEVFGLQREGVSISAAQLLGLSSEEAAGFTFQLDLQAAPFTAEALDVSALTEIVLQPTSDDVFNVGLGKSATNGLGGPIVSDENCTFKDDLQRCPFIATYALTEVASGSQTEEGSLLIYVEAQLAEDDEPVSAVVLFQRITSCANLTEVDGKFITPSGATPDIIFDIISDNGRQIFDISIFLEFVNSTAKFDLDAEVIPLPGFFPTLGELLTSFEASECDGEFCRKFTIVGLPKVIEEVISLVSLTIEGRDMAVNFKFNEEDDFDGPAIIHINENVNCEEEPGEDQTGDSAVENHLLALKMLVPLMVLPFFN